VRLGNSTRWMTKATPAKATTRYPQPPTAWEGINPSRRGDAAPCWDVAPAPGRATKRSRRGPWPCSFSNNRRGGPVLHREAGAAAGGRRRTNPGPAPSIKKQFEAEGGLVCTQREPARTPSDPRIAPYFIITDSGPRPLHAQSALCLGEPSRGLLANPSSPRTWRTTLKVLRHLKSTPAPLLEPAQGA